MRRTLLIALTLVLLLAASLPLAGCQRKVKITTGEIVICTAGEILEDNTEEVEVPEDEIMNYGVEMTVVTCEEHGDLSSMYDEAQLLIAEGDLAGAQVLLATILETDPNYRKAKEQHDAIVAGESPEPDDDEGTADAGDTPAPDGGTEEPTGPVASLTKYVPDAIDGYVAQGILADAASLSRQYLPTGGAADQMVIEVEQRASADAASQEQASMIGNYAGNSTTRTIAGRTVVAGTNGQYAAAVFVDGSLTVIVELHGQSGADLIEAAFAVVESITK